MPQIITVFAFLCKYLHLAYNSIATRFETWSAIGAMVTAAQNIGLHEDPSAWPIEQWEKVIRRRCWWLVYCAEKLFAHSFGRPSIVHDSDFTVAPLTEADQEEEGGGQHLLQMCQLALIVNDLMASLYLPRRYDTIISDVKKVEEVSRDLLNRLESWRSALPPQLAMDAAVTHGFNSNAFLHLSYFAIKISIHKALIRADGAEQIEHHRAALDTMYAVATWSRSK
jgi:hypothetical protein